MIRRLLLAACAVLLAAGTAGPAAADDRDDMYKRLGVDAVGADYLFLIDVSGSMKPVFASLRAELTKFSASLQAGDRVSFVTFRDDVRPRAWVAARSPAAAREIRSLPAPAPARTDFHRALSWGMNYLANDATGAGRVATMVLLSDGDPWAPGAAECALPPDRQWAPVRTLAQRLGTSRQLNGYAVPLAIAGKSCPATTSLSILRKVVPDAESLPADAGLADYLAQAKQSARASTARLKLVSAGELKKTVTVTWPSGEASFDPSEKDLRVPVQLSTSGVAPVVVADLTGAMTLTVTDGDGTRPVQLTARQSPATVTVAPGTTTEVDLTATMPQPGGIHLIAETVTASGSLAMTARITSPWLDLAGGDLPSRFSSALTPAQAEISGTGQRGVPSIIWLVVLILVVAAIVFFAVRYLRSRPVMTGYLRVTARGSDGVDVRLQNRMKVRRDLGPGVLEVEGVRAAGGEVKLRVGWTPATGNRVPDKTLPRGGKVIFNSVTVTHRERKDDPVRSSPVPPPGR
ncbi:VWA domain-containing protein [Actinoplanes bogorensis]|uniref:VWA domain-containing protein n=1 Tax=Paractinoplanes bogorensis TaxID=1610840 RepID=A0ABS5YLN8_9ACTN|nr:vWA domain-containing protein [Actinoplanes bogorensis]MBU2664377.1 VWA domain-containing protein [Actinoplanes bogorensis]